VFARCTREAVIELRDLGRRFRIAPGEMIMTEISRKFRADEMAATVARYGLETVRTFTDPTKAFALLLLRKRGRSALAEGRQRSAWTHLATARAQTLELIDPLDDARSEEHTSELQS